MAFVLRYVSQVRKSRAFSVESSTFVCETITNLWEDPDWPHIKSSDLLV